MSYRVCGGVVWALFLIVAAACSPTSHNAPLEAVEPLPSPSVPTWIRSVSPTQPAGTSAQIRVIFAAPVVPLGAIASDGEKTFTAHFHLMPAVAGHFRVLTPKMIAFEPEDPLPGATRFRVTVDAGTRDSTGNSLSAPLAWTFVTTPLRLETPSPDVDGDSSPERVTALQPKFRLRANAAVDAASLAVNASFSGGGEAVGASISTPSPQPSGSSDGLAYDLQPERPLKMGTKYELHVVRGVRPASGNLASAADVRIRFSTYGKFVAERIDMVPRNNDAARFEGGDPQIIFSNAVDPSTVEGNLSIEPKVASNVKVFSTRNDARTVAINPYLLTPGTRYTVTTQSGLRDIYGQSAAASPQSFTAGDFAPALSAPDSNAIFMSTAPLGLQYTVTNLPQNQYRAAYRIVDPQQLVYASDAEPQDKNSLLPSEGMWRSFSVNPARNREQTITLPLLSLMRAKTGMLAYGVSAIGIKPVFGTVQLTNLGIFAQWMPTGGFALVQRLDNGTPVRDAKVDVYVSHIGESGSGAQPCATVTTDNRGVASIAGTSVDRCSVGNASADEAPSLLFVVRNANDWAYAQVSSYSGMWTYPGDAGWSSGKPLSRGEIFSDRSMYQPGETAELTAVCYVYQNGVLRPDRNAPYSIKITDPDGKETPLATRTTNHFATFSFPLHFNRAEKLGYYSIQAASPDGATIYGSVRLAEFKPPNFNVSLALDKQHAAPSQTVHVTARGRYLFGTPMSGAAATAHVVRSAAYLSPTGWDEFTFGRQWFWPDEQPDLNGQVSVTNYTLDRNGETSFDIGVPADLPFAAQYTVDTEVTDVSHVSSADSKTFLALPADAVIGIKTDFAGTVGQPVNADAIVTDADGKAIEGRTVHVALQKMIYSGATEVVEGGEVARSQVRYETVAETDVTPGNKPARAQLVAKAGGSYRIRANFSGASSDATATDAQVWVSGPGTGSLGQENPTQLQLKLDRKTYRPGAMATLVVASPFEEADLHVYVIRDRILYQTAARVSAGAPRVGIPISPRFFPNAAVEAILVRRGAVPRADSPQRPDSLVRYGAVPLKLDTGSHSLRIAIQPRVAQARPAAEQSVRFEMRDAQG
ncbi:MAG: Ig-like domain-containing protein, partial [Candidatus Eremiobacteraeota bacterium]|nr:Ig-like domain-containing protein [Candidatus Eremiobacteraeota bacterium]